MSKHETFRDYPARGLAAAEAALLTLWPSLQRYHDELVLAAHATAVDALKNDFREAGSDGPVRAAEFLRGTVDEAQRIREDLVTVASALLEE